MNTKVNRYTFHYGYIKNYPKSPEGNTIPLKFIIYLNIIKQLNSHWKPGKGTAAPVFGMKLPDSIYIFAFWKN